jgi:hypothetical protein
MEKAYDVKELAKKLQGKGLAIAEEAAEQAAVAVFEWVEESAKISKTPYDDMGLIILPKLKELVLAAAEKIDGK